MPGGGEEVKMCLGGGEEVKMCLKYPKVTML